MRGTWQTEGTDLGRVAAVLGAAAVVGVVVWLIVTFLWLIAVIVGLAVATAIGGLVWLARHGGELATVARTALPAPEVTPLAVRPAQALPAPRIQVNNFYGLTPDQVAEVVRRQAITGRDD